MEFSSSCNCGFSTVVSAACSWGALHAGTERQSWACLRWKGSSCEGQRPAPPCVCHCRRRALLAVSCSASLRTALPSRSNSACVGLDAESCFPTSDDAATSSDGCPKRQQRRRRWEAPPSAWRHKMHGRASRSSNATLGQQTESNTKLRICNLVVSGTKNDPGTLVVCRSPYPNALPCPSRIPATAFSLTRLVPLPACRPHVPRYKCPVTLLRIDTDRVHLE